MESNRIESGRRCAPECGLRPVPARERTRVEVLAGRQHMLRLAMAAQLRRAAGRGRGRSVGVSL